MLDLDRISDKALAVVDNQTLMELYQIATSELYSYVYVKPTARHSDNMLSTRLTSDC